MLHTKTRESSSPRIESIDFLRGLVMVIMALDHTRMYFGLGTWYAEPTDLATTTPLLFFTLLFCTHTGFVGSAISAVVMVVLGTLLLRDKKDAAAH